MSGIARYGLRVGVMLFVALPATVVVLVVSGAQSQSVDPPALFETIGEAALLVYIWGGISGAILSVVHTAVTDLIRAPAARSVAISLLLGLLTGALTPTMFTPPFFAPAAALGAFAGLSYVAAILAAERLGFEKL